MFRVGAVSKLQHIAQHRNTPSGSISQDSQSRNHRLRAGVIAVPDNGVVSRPEDFLTAGEIPEGFQGLPDDLRRNSQLQSHSGSCQGIPHKVLSLQLHSDRHRQAACLHLEAQERSVLVYVQCPDITLLCTAKIGDPLCRLFLQIAQHDIVAIE